MKIKDILLLLVMFVTFAGCNGNGDYAPKPQAYLRIDMPEHTYWHVDSLCIHPGDTLVAGADTMVAIGGTCKTLPFTFEANECVELREKDAPKGEEWIDLVYPRWDGVVFLTYKRLHGAGDLRGQTDTSSRLLESHYLLHGRNVASTYQFWVTDSATHFLRGALYLNQTPNNDSLAPVLTYIQEDIDHLIETLRWR